MSIKYSEIYAASPIVGAGADDLIILAEVDGGAPTGYTTKGIKVSDFLSATGSIYITDGTLTADRTLDGDSNFLRFENLSNFTVVADIVVSSGTNGVSLLNDTTNDITINNTGSGGVNIYSSVGGTGDILLQAGDDDVNILSLTGDVIIQGLIYPDVDGSPGEVLVTDGFGNLSFAAGSGDGNGLFDVANDGGTIPTTFEADLTNDLNIGANTLYINKGVGIGVNSTSVSNMAFRVHGFDTGRIASFRNHLGTTEVMAIYNDSQVVISATAVDSRLTLGTSESASVKFRLRSQASETWTIRAERSTGAIAFEVKESGNCAMNSASGGPLLFTDAASSYVGIGTVTPTERLHVKGGNVLVEGSTDLNLLNIARATQQFAIGSTPYANTKASITNTEGVTYSFLVLNQATTFEFSVREAGVVYTNGIITIGVPTPTSASKFQIGNGDLELANTGWFYSGDPSTDGSWRFGPNGGSDFLHQRREVGVWVTKNTITP